MQGPGQNGVQLPPARCPPPARSSHPGLKGPPGRVGPTHSLPGTAGGWGGSKAPLTRPGPWHPSQPCHEPEHIPAQAHCPQC